MILEFALVAALPCVSSVSLGSYLTTLNIMIVPILKCVFFLGGGREWGGRMGCR